MKLIFSANDILRSLIRELLNCTYLALNFLVDLLIKDRSIINDVLRVCICWLARQLSGDKGMRCRVFLARRAIVFFQSSTSCKQAVVLIQTHHNMLILKSRFSKHNRWETRRQVWQLIFWYLLPMVFQIFFSSFAAVQFCSSHLPAIKYTSFTIYFVTCFHEMQSLF